MCGLADEMEPPERGLAMPDPAEGQRAIEDQPPFEFAAESQFIDRLIDWAIGQGDAAVDELHTYLSDRARPQPVAAGPVRYPRRSGPYWGQGSGTPGFARRSQHGCSPRPLGGCRPRRLPG